MVTTEDELMNLKINESLNNRKSESLNNRKKIGKKENRLRDSTMKSNIRVT